MVVRIVTSVARHEGEQRSLRQRVANRQKAATSSALRASTIAIRPRPSTGPVGNGPPDVAEIIVGEDLAELPAHPAAHLAALLLLPLDSKLLPRPVEADPDVDRSGGYTATF